MGSGLDNQAKQELAERNPFSLRNGSEINIPETPEQGANETREQTLNFMTTALARASISRRVHNAYKNNL